MNTTCIVVLGAVLFCVVATVLFWLIGDVPHDQDRGEHGGRA